MIEYLLPAIGGILIGLISFTIGYDYGHTQGIRFERKRRMQDWRQF